ncbi:MAG: hypothetical protein M3N19_01370 [Candidatus Eremiobacteraeota bacterium]|nr:hypothetical protein [Candidatus Eremiobacteraeota bacterium]
MQNIQRFSTALLLLAAAAVCYSPQLAAKTQTTTKTQPPVEVRFIPCPIKQHQIEADWYACTTSATLPVAVYGSYEMSKTPGSEYFAHVYLDVPRSIDAPSVRWSDSNHLVAFPSTNDTFDGPAQAVAAPGYQLLLPSLDAHKNSRSGRTTIVATISGSIKKVIRFPAIVYQTIRMGCSGVTQGPGAAFATQDRSAPATSAQTSDLYVTGPAQAQAGIPESSGCPAAFADSSNDSVLHFPAGGILVKTDRFDRLAVTQWKADRTSISLSDIKDPALLFKTRQGLIAKLLIRALAPGRVAGVYETANSHGVFPY